MYKGLSAIPRKTTWLRRERVRFERADGGTIFLDEIWEIPTTTRLLLLGVLQEKEFERAGGKIPSSCGPPIKRGQMERFLWHADLDLYNTFTKTI